MKEVDPDEVRERRAKTLKEQACHSPVPSSVWHVDGYNAQALLMVAKKSFGSLFHAQAVTGKHYAMIMKMATTYFKSSFRLLCNNLE